MGAILNVFAGASGGLAATLPTSISVSDTTGTVGGPAAIAALYINTNNAAASLPGSWTTWINVTATQSGATTWLTGSGSGANYDVRFDLISGTLGTIGIPSSAANTWLTGSSTYVWTARQASASANTSIVTGTLSIRNASTLAVLATSSITLTATIS